MNFKQITPVHYQAIPDTELKIKIYFFLYIRKVKTKN